MKLALAQIEDQRLKRTRFSEEQIIAILKEHEAGIAVAELCRKHGVSEASKPSGWSAPAKLKLGMMN